MDERLTVIVLMPRVRRVSGVLPCERAWRARGVIPLRDRFGMGDR